MIKLDHLRVFLAVAEAGSLADAGARLSRSAAALSMTLRLIEQSLGGVLFIGERKAQLSPLGRVVLDQARRAVRSHDQAVLAIEEFASGQTGIVRVATVPSVAAALLPLAAARFHADGAVRLDLRDTDSASVQQAVAQGSADIGVASITTPDDSLHADLLTSDPLRIVTRRDHPLAALSRPLDWSDIADYPFIGNGLCDQLSIPQLSQLAQNATLFIHNVTALQAFIERGDAVSLLPELSLGMYPALRAHRLNDARLSRDLHLIRRRDDLLSPAAARFALALRAVVQDMARGDLNSR